MNKSELQSFLEEKYVQFNNFNFIENDPIKIPHEYSSPKDIEIAGLFSAVIAWGNRKSIIKNGYSLMERMDESGNISIQLFKNLKQNIPLLNKVFRRQISNIFHILHFFFENGIVKKKVFLLAR